MEIKAEYLHEGNSDLLSPHKVTVHGLKVIYGLEEKKQEKGNRKRCFMLYSESRLSEFNYYLCHLQL
jgi:hypothetical protein